MQLCLQTWLFKSNHHIKTDMECTILLSATPVSEPQLVQIIVSTKYFAVALHGAVAEKEIRDQGVFLQGIAAAALAPDTEDAPLTMVEKV